jgi:predicted Zn-dependent protease
MRHPFRPLLLALALPLLAYGCGTNPVTGKKELHLISTEREIAIGSEQYLPSRQAQGGDLVVDPALTAYVQRIGAKLAAASDRQLPYEFVVLASGVPNAWALPGGKIAVNRGLLLALEDEAELAAVLGHEIVHAAARHGAQSMERGLLAQVGLAAVAIGAADDKHRDLIVGGATLGATLITTKYGRDAESEADRYGMTYMVRAGYDPHAAVTLQEKFVKLSAGKQGGWLEGLFASHPPSPDRVAANARTEQALLAGGAARGTLNAAEYRKALAAVVADAPAYAAYDQGRAALAKGDAKGALALAQQAAKAAPREALFPGLAGVAHEKLGDPAAAAKDYDAAIERNPNFFEFWLRRGLLRKSKGDAAGARADLEHAHGLLPTAASAEALGQYALAGGDEDRALGYLRQAAGSRSPEGQRAAQTVARLELARDPGRFVQVGAELDGRGMVVLVIANRAPLAVQDVKLVALLRDPVSGVQQGSQQFALPNRIAPGAALKVATRLGPLASPEALRGLKVEVRGAAAVQ